jgi:hypothetical protein
MAHRMGETVGHALCHGILKNMDAADYQSEIMV